MPLAKYYATVDLTKGGAEGLIRALFRKAIAGSARQPSEKHSLAKNAQIAQSVEQRIENPRVGGSIPPLGTITH